MGPVAEFGMGMGLAGAAGIRARYPLVILGLLTRYSEQVFLRDPFRFLGSSFILLLITILIILDFFAGLKSEEAAGYSSVKPIIRALAGGLIFAAVVGGFSGIWGLLFGIALAVVSQVVDQRLTGALKTVDSAVNSRHFHDILAFAATVTLIILPLMGYALWVVLFVLVVRHKEWYSPDNRRYRNLR